MLARAFAREHSRGDKSCRTEPTSDPPSYFFTSVALLVCVIEGLPPLPLIVNGYVPRASEPDTVTVNVVDAPVAGLGAKVAVAPAGKPDSDIVIGALNPPVREIVTV